MLEAEYIAAFGRCYPHKTIELKAKKMGPGDWRTRVIIDGDPGDVILTDDDMREAIRMFNRGRS